MEDTIVSFEIAKLLKEKGYTSIVGIINGKHYYNYKGELDGDQTDYLKARIRKEDLTPFRNYSAPTLSLAQKWLREVHNIHIQIIFLSLNNRYVFEIYKYGEDNIESVLEYSTYELALEQGILESLKLLK